MPGELAAVEGVAEAGEEALLPRLELARRLLFAAQLGQVAQQLLLLGVEPGRGLHRHVDDQVPAAVAVQVLHAQAVQRDDLPGLRTRADVDVARAVERLDLHGRAERRGHHRDRQRAVQVVALPLEDRVRPLHDLEEQVAGGAAARAGLTLAGQLDVRPVLDAGRDPDLHRPPGAHAAVAVALWARARQHGPVAAAGR